METTESLGRLLKDLRASQGMSQEATAAAAGVARSTLNRWERGAFQPRLPELEATLTALGAPPPLREQALALIAAPRAIRSLRDKRKPEVSSESVAWVYVPDTGDLLQTMRLRTGRTQGEIAEHIGVQRSTVSSWESGELLPSAERLNQLATLLAAHPEEHMALARGLLTSRSAEDASLEEIEFRLNQIAGVAYDASREPVKDLEYLRLERVLARKASHSSAARHMLLHAYSNHAQWLADKGRYREASRYVDRVMEAGCQEATPGPQWLRASLTAARCAVYGGDQVRPERGVEILQQWLPGINDPSFEAWVLGDMAFYLAQDNHREAALELVVRACRVAQRCENPAELRYRRVDRAELLLRIGNSETASQALDLLPAGPAYDPVERVREAMLWSKALLLINEASESHAWRERANAIAQDSHLDPSTVRSLSERL